MNGVPMREIARENPTTFIRYHKGITALQAATTAHRGIDDKTICLVFYGAGGTGKTTFAQKLAAFIAGSTQRVYVLPAAKASGTYWTNYNAGDVVVIDEMKGNRFEPTFFNKLIDGGPMFVPGYGCELVFNSRFVIITTNVSPRHWWPKVQFMRSLQRRILCFPLFRHLGFVPRARSARIDGVSALMAPPEALKPWEYGYPQ